MARIRKQTVDVVNTINKEINEIHELLKLSLEQHKGKKIFKKIGFLMGNVEYLEELINGVCIKLLKVGEHTIRFRYNVIKSGDAIICKVKTFNTTTYTGKEKHTYIGRLDKDSKLVDVYDVEPLKTDYNVEEMIETETKMEYYIKRANELKEELKEFL